MRTVLSKVSSWQCSRKTRLSNETFYTLRSVIRQPETLSILTVLHILDTSKRWLSLNSELRTLYSRRFAKVVETKNSEVNKQCSQKTQLSPVNSPAHVVDIFPTYGNFCCCFFKLTVIRSFRTSELIQIRVIQDLSHNCWIRRNWVTYFADTTNGSSQKIKRYEAKNVQNHIHLQKVFEPS